MNLPENANRWPHKESLQLGALVLCQVEHSFLLSQRDRRCEISDYFSWDCRNFYLFVGCYFWERMDWLISGMEDPKEFTSQTIYLTLATIRTPRDLGCFWRVDGPSWSVRVGKSSVWQGKLCLKMDPNPSNLPSDNQARQWNTSHL